MRRTRNLIKCFIWLFCRMHRVPSMTWVVGHLTTCWSPFSFICLEWFGSYLCGTSDWFHTHLVGKWLGNRQIRCNWATKGAGFNEDKQVNENQNAVVLTNGSSGIVNLFYSSDHKSCRMARELNVGCCYSFVTPGLGFHLHGDICMFIEPQIPCGLSPVNLKK